MTFPVHRSCLKVPSARVGIAFLISWLLSPGVAAQELTTDAPAITGFDSSRNQILFQVHFGEAGPYWMALDTAIDPSAVDRQVAKDLGLEVDLESPIPAAGIGTDHVIVYPTVIEGLTVDGHEFAPVPAVAMDLSPLAARLERPLHGILGYSFLRGRAVRIDYPNRTLTIYDGAAPVPDGPAFLDVPLELHGTVPRLEQVFLNGRRLSVGVDTGASLTIHVFSRAVGRLGLAELRASARVGQVRGARGLADILETEADSLRIGTFALSAPDVAFSTWSVVGDGLLGNGAFRELVLFIDYVREQLRLEPSRRRASEAKGVL